MPKQLKHVDAQLVIKAKELYMTGLTLKEVGDKLGYSKSTISRWLRNIHLPNRIRLIV